MKKPTPISLGLTKTNPHSDYDTLIPQVDFKIHIPMSLDHAFHIIAARTTTKSKKAETERNLIHQKSCLTMLMNRSWYLVSWQQPCSISSIPSGSCSLSSVVCNINRYINSILPGKSCLKNVLDLLFISIEWLTTLNQIYNQKWKKFIPIIINLCTDYVKY